MMQEPIIKPIFCHKTINKHKYKIFTFSIMCALISLVICINLSKHWYAQVVLVIGKDYLIDTTDSGIKSTPIEPTAIIIEKLKSKELQNEVLRKTNINPTIEDSRANLFYNSLMLKPIKDTDAVHISLKANSKLLSSLQARLLCEYIINQHLQITNNSKLTLEQKRLFLQNQINYINDNKLNNNTKKDNSVLTLNLIQIYLKQINDLNQELFKVNLALQNLKLNPTKILNSVQVSEQPVFPKKSVFLICGFAIGLLISTIAVHLIYNKKI